MLKPIKITIEYEGGSQVIIDGNKAEASRFLKWLYELAIPRWDTGNYLDKALVSLAAQIVLPNGQSRAFQKSDTVL